MDGVFYLFMVYCVLTFFSEIFYAFFLPHRPLSTAHRLPARRNTTRLLTLMLILAPFAFALCRDCHHVTTSSPCIVSHATTPRRT